MDKIQSIEAFHALAHMTRLDVFRLLVRSAPDGMAAGDIADNLDVRQNTMSANLAVLSRAGLVHAERHGRSIIYRADMAALRGLLAFIMEDCCGGQPELCRPLLEELVCDC